MTIKDYNIDISDEYLRMVNGLEDISNQQISEMKNLYDTFLRLSTGLTGLICHHESLFSINLNLGESVDIDEDVLDGFVYIARQTNEKNLYKIGMTKNLSKRERTFKTGNMFVDIVASMKHAKYKDIEKLLHNKLNGRRLSGEWFLLDEILLQEIIKNFGFNIHVS